MAQITKIYGIKTKRDALGNPVIDKESKKPITRRTYIGYIKTDENGKQSTHFDYLPIDAGITLEYETKETGSNNARILTARELAMKTIKSMRPLNT